MKDEEYLKMLLSNPSESIDKVVFKDNKKLIKLRKFYRLNWNSIPGSTLISSFEAGHAVIHLKASEVVAHFRNKVIQSNHVNYGWSTRYMMSKRRADMPQAIEQGLGLENTFTFYSPCQVAHEDDNVPTYLNEVLNEVNKLLYLMSK